MHLSLREAADACGASKSTILRAIQRGRLSATRDDDGGWQIDPAELHRVYPPRTTRTGASTDAAGQSAPPPAPDATAVLDAQLEALREVLRRADQQLADVREDRDRWRAQAEQATRLLTDQRERRSWWRRLVG
jgi:excisionase family DNA binding protein